METLCTSDRSRWLPETGEFGKKEALEALAMRDNLQPKLFGDLAICRIGARQRCKNE